MKKFLYISLILIITLFVSNTTFSKTETEYKKAIHYYNTGKYKEAIDILKEYVKTRPEAPAYYRIGYALYKIGNYEEANNYFQQAYLIDPSFSPEIISPIKKQPLKSKIITKKPAKPAQTIGEKPALPSDTTTTLVTKPSVEKELKKTTEKDLSKPQEITTTTPPKEFQRFPMPKKVAPPAPPLLKGISAIMSGLGIITIFLELALYIFFSLCLFLIAKKLEISAPGIAFIPIIQIWTLVKCAGKPWWWILLLLIPFINIIISILLWVYITENLGKNKWLGLLMILPIINFVFLGYLAFSKTEGVEAIEEVTTS